MAPGNPGCLAICAIRPSQATPAAAGSTAASTAGAATGATAAAAGEPSDMVAGFGVPQGGAGLEMRGVSLHLGSHLSLGHHVACVLLVVCGGPGGSEVETRKSRQQCNRHQSPAAVVGGGGGSGSGRRPVACAPLHPRTHSTAPFRLQQKVGG